MSERVLDPQDPRFVAAIDLLRRTGLRTFQIRYQDDEQPTVWLAVGEWSRGPDGRPVAKGGAQVFEAAGATNPVQAVMRLCDQVVDGGTCAHCRRPAGVTDDWRSDMPLATVVCWQVYDPELKRFRRSCEGETGGATRA